MAVTTILLGCSGDRLKGEPMVHGGRKLLAKRSSRFAAADR
jgi:hypothetical protein